MPDKTPGAPNLLQQRQMALSTWDGEGGAGPLGSQDSARRVEDPSDDGPRLTHAELVQIRIRVIALENLVIALLAEASDEQRGRAFTMAAFIAPRAGFTPHPLTVQAAAKMTDLVDRACHFRGRVPEHFPDRKNL